MQVIITFSLKILIELMRKEAKIRTIVFVIFNLFQRKFLIEASQRILILIIFFRDIFFFEE